MHAFQLGCFHLALPALLVLSAACGTGEATPAALADARPFALDTKPTNASVNVWNGQQFSATFNKAMDPASLTTSTFFVLQGSNTVEGSVSYDGVSRIATFLPAAPLGAGLPFTATITTGARSASGRSLAAALSWSVTTRMAALAPAPVNLGMAGNYAILAQSGISSVPASAITGNIAVSPAAATYITGFSLTADPSNAFWTASQVTGKVFAADGASPTPSELTTAVLDMGTAFTDAAGRAADVTELGTGNLGGMTLLPGVYKWGTGVLIPTDLHLSGGPDDVFILEIAQNLTLASGVRIFLDGGLVAQNVFWQVSGLVALGTTAHLEGIVLSQTAITLATGASVNGRLLAQSAVTLDQSTVVAPGSLVANPQPVAAAAQPLSGAVGVSRNQVISATFDVSMDPTTLTAATFTLSQSGALVPGVVSYSAASNTATFTPAAPLDAGLLYTATLSVEVKSAAGTPLAAAVSWSFTTLAEAPAPIVSATDPLAGAVDVSKLQILSATFDLGMDAASLTTDTFTLQQGAAAVAGTVSYNLFANAATFTSTAPLAGSLTYTATITTGAKSTLGSNLAAAYSWSFTTVADLSAPLVSVTSPGSTAVGVPFAQLVSVTFNEAMDPTSLTVDTFVLLQGSTAVAGSVAYDAVSHTATFRPAAPLGSALLYTATLFTGVKSAAGLPLAANYAWSFTSAFLATGTPPVNLGTAGNYAILAETGISTVPPSVITGDIAVSPIAATAITGFSLTADASNVFWTTSQVTGRVFAADCASPTPAALTTAVLDMGTAFVDAAGRAASVTELGAGNVGGMTLVPGVYKWSSGLLIPTDLHLVGNATDVWIFEIAQNLTMASATNVVLSGGALAKNVFWQVSGLVALGTTAHLEGIVLSQTAITLATGASVNGRLLAQSAVTLDASTVVAPAP